MTIKDQVIIRLAQLPSIQANDIQIDQIASRIQQIISESEYVTVDERTQINLVQQVWPIAQYVDTP